MEDDDIFNARYNAASSLSQLLFKDSSVEAAVRSVLRIAEHRRNTWWRLWATLQLSTLDAATWNDQLGTILDDEFPEEKASQRERLLDEAIDEYNYLRASRVPFTTTTAALAVIEKELTLAETAYAQDPEGLGGARGMVLAFTEILSRIKSRVQGFLSDIERGRPPGLPPRRTAATFTGPLVRTRPTDAGNNT